MDAVQGDAKRVLESFEITRVNYTIAWDLLKERFENKAAIIQSHLKNIIDMPLVARESTGLLLKLLDNLQKHMLALKTLGEPTESWDRIIILLIARKLDIETKKEWEEKTIMQFQGNPTFKDFTDFLANRCKVLESIEPINNQMQVNKKYSRDTRENKMLTHAAKKENVISAREIIIYIDVLNG